MPEAAHSSIAWLDFGTDLDSGLFFELTSSYLSSSEPRSASMDCIIRMAFGRIQNSKCMIGQQAGIQDLALPDPSAVPMEQSVLAWCRLHTQEG